MNYRILPVVVAAVLLILAASAGCTGSSGNAGTGTGDAVLTDVPAASAGTGTEITVFAAASLKGALTEIADKFMTKYPEYKVVINFAGSQALRTQLEEGAQADMYISANNKQFDPLVSSGLIKEKKILLKNKLAVAVPVENRKGIKGLEDLDNKDVVLVIGNDAVPFGQYTRDIVSKFNKTENGYEGAFFANVVSEVDAVDKIKPVLVLGEADASIVYKSDVGSDDRKYITLIAIPDEYNVIAEYPYGLISDTDGVKAFETYLIGDDGDAVLIDYGFDVN